MTETHRLLRHVLATLAYRTQKAVRDAPDDFARFDAGNRVRTPHELVCHMTSVLGYACAQLGVSRPTVAPRATWHEELARFHATLADLSELLAAGAQASDASLEALLQGPLSDAMTHAGQLAMLRRLSGHPVEPEDFARAHIDADVVGADQPLPASPGRRDRAGADPLR